MNNEIDYDKLKSEQIRKMQNKIDSYNSFINSCAQQDRVVEDIIQIAKELESIHYEQFNDIVKSKKR